jgi:hypothetical protein
MVDLKDARWSVTEFGLEAVNPDFEPYRIPLSELLEVDSEGFISLYVCPMCVSQQVGVDIEAFLDAWRRAVKVHDRFLPKVAPKNFCGEPSPGSLECRTAPEGALEPSEPHVG